MSELLLEYRKRYEKACHAMQSGVATEISIRGEENSKHLRVGINSALVETGMLAKILIEKGMITEEEHVRYLAEAMEREVARYTEYLERRFGVKVVLG